MSSRDPFDRLYPTARIRGRLVTRLPERPLGWVSLNAATAEEMGREQIGWFIGGHPGESRVAGQLAELDANPEGGIWIVSPFSRDLSRKLYETWAHPDHISKRPGPDSQAWGSRKVWVAVPEDLKDLLPFARKVANGVAGLIVLDTPCIIYRTRGGTDSWGSLRRSDRPQHVVNFRAAFDDNGWQPPLLLITAQAAAAITTQTVARAFCLNGFRFIAGNTFDCWDEPIDQD